LRILRYEQPITKPTLHLVAVGVSRYAGIRPLRFARTDAEAFTELFQRRGKTLYRDVVVHPLLDEQATAESIRTTLQRVAGQAAAQDTLLLFLAGHGVLVGQRYYFVPHEFTTTAGKTRDADIREQCLPADVLADFLSSGAALKRLLILDTCASGGVVDLFQVATRGSQELRGEVEALSRSQGIYVLAAASATEEAQEPDSLGHGVLSYSLLAGLKAVDRGPLTGKWVQPRDEVGVASVLEWFGFAANHAPKLTREYCGHEQSIHAASRGNNFPILTIHE
jgi:uncharacterized caspase-like protein